MQNAKQLKVDQSWNVCVCLHLLLTSFPCKVHLCLLQRVFLIWSVMEPRFYSQCYKNEEVLWVTVAWNSFPTKYTAGFEVSLEKV